MKTKKWITYTIYAILITGIFLYVRFPSDTAANYIKSTLMKGNPDIVFSFDSADLCLPPGIKLGNAVIGFRNKPDVSFRTDTLKIRPVVSHLLSGKLSFLLEADTYGGNIRTDIHFANLLSTRGPFSINAVLSDIDLGKCSCLEAATGRRINGILSGSLSYHGKQSGITSGTGNARFSLIDGRVQLLKDIFSLGELDFEMIGAEITLRNRTLKITDMEIAGKQLRGSFGGNIFLNKNIMRSRLAIKGNIKINAMETEIPTTLNGTIANPVPRFM